ncbi:hypothetical protein V9T40_011519 [Parthenolecanium corni]|uniref:Uncharacterized protein n=1 Tax=Parthenolecanium corni TaxID=536013 RepID=A0AAN9T5L9_9HEMI
MFPLQRYHDGTSGKKSIMNAIDNNGTIEQHLIASLQGRTIVELCPIKIPDMKPVIMTLDITPLSSLAGISMRQESEI